MPNDNIMGIPTKACINGLTKEDTERLKNALIKKIEDNETTVNVTEDGKVIVADNSGFYLSYDGNMIGIEQDISGDYIPKTVPYLPEDVNENPLAPPNDTIMTSANIAVDPRIVHTTGNETISGIKSFNQQIKGFCSLKVNDSSSTGTANYYKTLIKVDKSKLVGVRTHTVCYFTSRTRGRGFDFISLYTSNRDLVDMSLILRSNTDNYTYILSEDTDYIYISTICRNDVRDAMQSGILFATDTIVLESFIIGSTEISETLIGTEKMRITP